MSLMMGLLQQNLVDCSKYWWLY